jgi:MIP family channel proteins
MVMVYATGHISGAHMNPAVTIAFAITRHFPTKELAPYIAAQCIGAILAAWVLKATLTPALHDTDPNAFLNLGVSLPLDGRWVTGVVWEFILTFVLMFVIMSVATDTRAIGKAAGIVIGGTVWFEAMFAGPICGASMNPARSLGPALIQGDMTLLWVYLLAPTLGALCGGLVYQLLRAEQTKPV